MKNRYSIWLFLCLVLLLGVSFSIPAKSDVAGNPGFKKAEAAYYLPEDIFTLIEPGVVIELIEFEIPADNQPLATFSLTSPAGRPLDIEGEFTPGAFSIRWMLSYIPLGEENKITYHLPEDRRRDGDGEYTYLGDGIYTYKFATVLPDNYQVDATHTLGVAARRDLRDWGDFGLSRYYDNIVYNFVPSGASEPIPRDIVTTATCDRCHDAFEGLGHPQTYQEVQICQNCHNPALYNEEEDLSYSLNVVIHRLHSGNQPGAEMHYPPQINDCEVCHTGGTPTDDVPLVANPNPAVSCDGSGVGMTTMSWADIGPAEIRINSEDGKLFGQANGAGSADTGNWVKDGMEFFLLDADGEVADEQKVNLSVAGCVGNAPYTFRGSAGVLHSNWMTRPTRAACGGCHEYGDHAIDWETGENHAGGPQDDDEFCSLCHKADSGEEYDSSVRGAHIVERNSKQLNGVLVQIKSVTNTGPGLRPTVTFSAKNKGGAINPNNLNRLRFRLAGPNEDFSFHEQENAVGQAVATGSDWSYTFDTKLPMDAEGSWSVSFEARDLVTIETHEGEDEVRDQSENYLFPIAVTDATPVPRRLVVDDEKCENCHSNLALHGGNRHNGGEYCQNCHMPAATGETEVVEGEEDSIHFKYMIHKIHAGAQLEFGYAVGGHVYDEVHFPRDLSDCEACHVDDSYELPLPQGVLPTVTPNPNSFTDELQPIAAACLSCHDSFVAAAHADANTGGLGESCEACHGEGKTYAVSRVHAE